MDLADFVAPGVEVQIEQSSGAPLLDLHHLDYVSCLLTIASTLLVGRRMWQGWVVAGANSVIICLIGLRTAQWGFVPANIFCLGLYAYNLRNWRASAPEAGQAESPTGPLSARLKPSVRLNRWARLGQDEAVALFHHGQRAGDERLTSNRIRQRTVPDSRESRPAV